MSRRWAVAATAATLVLMTLGFDWAAIATDSATLEAFADMANGAARVVGAALIGMTLAEGRPAKRPAAVRKP